jgi:hypothetical protein
MDNPEEQNYLYCIQLLQAFDLEEWNDNIVNTTLADLYSTMKSDAHLQTILLKLSKNDAVKTLMYMDQNQAEDNDIQLFLFNILFQYDYFDLFHKCIISFMLNKNIGMKEATALREII